MEHIAQYAQVLKLLFEDEAAHGLLQPSKRRTVEAASERLAGVFRQSVAEGIFRPEDPLAVAHRYAGTLQSQRELEELDDQREALHRLILGTFFERDYYGKTSIGQPSKGCILRV